MMPNAIDYQLNWNDRWDFSERRSYIEVFDDRVLPSTPADDGRIQTRAARP